MQRPLIAVSAAIQEIETAFGMKDCTTLITAHTDAIYAAGGQPVVMPVVADPPLGLLRRMDGLMLTGGGDIDPALYGEDADPAVYGVRKERDAFESALYRESVALGLPVLAICRGMQLVNVLRGGTLLQQVADGAVHWQGFDAAKASHAVDIEPGSALFDAVGARVAHVNSYHHQGVKDLGAGLTVTATCGAVIEAFETAAADLVAVQWHPEHMTAADPRQCALFEAFVHRASQAARIRTTVL